MYKSKRERIQILRSQLGIDREPILQTWRDVNEYISPSRGRFLISDANRGSRRSTKIIDSTASYASRVLRSGMMSGVTSPTRPWFRLTTPDPDLAEFGSVKDWLWRVNQRMYSVYARSNIYKVLPMVYGDMGDYGTAAMMLEEDFDSTVHATSFPIGSYRLGCNYKGHVDTFQRDFRMTVRMIVQKFGRPEGMKTGPIDWSKISSYVKKCFDEGNMQVWIDVCHTIEPNDEFDPKKLSSKYKRFSSTWMELGSASGTQTSYMQTGDDQTKILRESGYDYFPVMAPRWEVTGEDAYGSNCPGLMALGDVKQLQHGEKKSLKAVDKQIDPPLVGSPQIKSAKISMLPGDVSYVEEREGVKGLRALHEVRFDISQLESKQEQVRQRINDAYYVPLFLAITNLQREATAREIDAREQEKLIALGPVLEQLNGDALDPMTDIVYRMMERQDKIPDVPEELDGVDLKVEYISIMAQAQKMVGISSVERFTSFVGQVAEADPSVLDKVDADQLVDTYGEMMSVPPGIIRTDDDVAAIRGERAKAKQAEQKAAMLQQGSVAAKNLSQASMTDDNALTRILNPLSSGAG